MTNLDKELLVLCGLEHKEHIVPKKQKSKKNPIIITFLLHFFDYQFIGCFDIISVM